MILHITSKNSFRHFSGKLRCHCVYFTDARFYIIVLMGHREISLAAGTTSKLKDFWRNTASINKEVTAPLESTISII